MACEDSPDEVHVELTRLQAAEFLYEAGLFPEIEYTFKHPLTHEAAYQSLFKDQQRALHARITETIERVSPERLAEQTERLAHHALRGELWEKAVTYLRQAGLRALARDANQETVAYQEQALAALRHLPETRQTIELTIDIHIEIRNSLFGLADHTRGGDHLRDTTRRVTSGLRPSCRSPCVCALERPGA
jgi:predicted ATPase